MDRRRSLSEGWVELPNYYEAAIQEDPIRSEDVNPFLRAMRVTSSGSFIASMFLSRKIKSSTTALRAFDFVEASLEAEAEMEGSAEFGGGTGITGFLCDVSRLLWPAEYSNEISDPVKARAIRFLTDATFSKMTRWFPNPATQTLLGQIYSTLTHNNVIQLSSSVTRNQSNKVGTSQLKNLQRRRKLMQKGGKSKFRIHRWKGFKNDLLEIWKSKAMSDVVFKCRDGTIHAHKLILSARSEVFRAMFGSGMVESGVGAIVEIQDTSCSTLELLFEFLYTGCVSPPTLDSLAQLIQASDKYQINSLKTDCFQLLVRRASVVNAAQLVLLAHTYNPPSHIKLKIQEYILRMRGTLMDIPEFMQTLNAHPAPFASIVFDKFNDH